MHEDDRHDGEVRAGEHTPYRREIRSFVRREGRMTDAQKRRSEEHTSELQSLMRISYAVFCLTKTITTHASTTGELTRSLRPVLRLWSAVVSMEQPRLMKD